MLLLKNVIHQGQKTDILIQKNYFSRIAPRQEIPSQAEVLECEGLAILPPFYNGHTHAAMSLLRSYANDLDLHNWLENYIWPAEANLNEEDIYAGSRLAILEMIKSGTVFFSDMYWKPEQTIRAVEEMGVRAAIGITIMDRMGEESINEAFQFLRSFSSTSSRIQLSVSPHAIYTVSGKNLQRSCQEARQAKVKLHIHLSETKKEVEDCIREHGCSPVEYLERLGVLNEDTIAAHGVFLSDTDIDILLKRGVTIVHNPISNMKLSSGIFDLINFRNKGGKLILGTDGASSNDNVSMIEEMKFAALLAKVKHSCDAIKASQIMEIASRKGAEAFGIKAGVIKEGYLADAVLLSLQNERLVPCYDLISNWVYSADSACVDTVICDGRVIMQGRKVDGEEEILYKAQRCAKKFK